MKKHDFWLILLSGYAIWQLDAIALWPQNWVSILLYAPILAACLAIFIGVFLNKSQPVLLSALILLTNVIWLEFDSLAISELNIQRLYPILCVLLPVNWLIFNGLPERGLNARIQFIAPLMLLIVEPFVVMHYLEALPKDWFNWLNYSVANPDIYLAAPGLITFFISWFVLLLRNTYQQNRRVFNKATLYGLVLMGLALNAPQTLGAMAWFSSFAVLFIILSLIFDSHHIAYVDELTGLKGRRALFEDFMALGRRYTIAMMDIDHFKKFNDTYGHETGDAVLRVVAQQLAKVSGGKPYRYGGEEFVVVFVNKTPEQVKDALDKVRTAIEQQDLEVPHQGKMTHTQVTVSFGFADKTSAANQPEAVMKLADEALYVAKKKGRNQVVAYEA